ncbi:hypothetical protein SARC_16355, partial [Sphaeroforma arctica JP610]
ILNQLPGVAEDMVKQQMFFKYHDRLRHRLDDILKKRRKLLISDRRAAWLN